MALICVFSHAKLSDKTSPVLRTAQTSGPSTPANKTMFVPVLTQASTTVHMPTQTKPISASTQADKKVSIPALAQAGTIMFLSNPTTPKCPECGVITVSGTVSCCAYGGSWFQKCGDPGDSHFEYTWMDGIEACASKSASKFI